MAHGLELVFETVRRDLVRKNDVVIVLIHWKLIFSGFLCLPLGEACDTNELSELLPPDWNKNSELYEIKYFKKGKLHILKAINLGSQLIINFMRVTDETVVSVTLDLNEKEIGPNFHTFKSAFKSKDHWESIIDKDFKTLLVEKGKSPIINENIDDSQLRNQPERKREEYSLENPFGSDIDPLGRGGGGMLFDPRSRGRIQQPGGVPFGALPPGARFDPFGPPDINDPPWKAEGARRPRQFGPDNDHLPPPGSNDMFM